MDNDGTDATGEAVSLGQILWVQDDDVRKLFLIARSARSIQGDFGGLQESKSWKKALKQRGFEVEESFNDYAEKAVRYLKMESTTTLALFSQTVAIKEITHVSTFIRDHMLERLDTRELMERLEQHYEDLTKCWDAIQRARKQLDLLQPVADKAAEIKTHQVELDAAARFNEALPACFAKRLKSLLETELMIFTTHGITSLAGPTLTRFAASKNRWLKSKTPHKHRRYWYRRPKRASKRRQSAPIKPEDWLDSARFQKLTGARLPREKSNSKRANRSWRKAPTRFVSCKNS